MAVDPQSDGSLSRDIPVLPNAGIVDVFMAGRQALTDVKGIHALVMKGFVLLYTLFISLGLIGGVGIYRYVLKPVAENIARMNTYQSVWLDLIVGLLNALLWIGQFLLLVVTLLLMLRITIAAMGVWFEVLVERIVLFRRAQAGEAVRSPASFELGPWLRSVGRGLRAGLISLLGSVLAIFLGFFPVVGPLAALSINVFLMGRDIASPYVEVRRQLDGPGVKAQHRPLMTLKLGTLPLLLSMVPYLGWLALPSVMIYLVAGVAWLGESRRLEDRARVADAAGIQ